MGKHVSTKTYGNDRGLSCCFRQWRSVHSHCSLLHGYSIGIKLIFESDTLDDRNWVMDFGGLEAFKAWAEYMFDHTLIVAKDDPKLSFFETMNTLVDENSPYVHSEVPNERGAVCDLRIVDAVGCEKFSELAYKTMTDILETFQRREKWFLKNQEGKMLKVFTNQYPVGTGVRVRSAEVFEHGANSAMYEG